MKDIHEIQDIQPCRFNHVRYMGVVDKAGSLHLIYIVLYGPQLGQKGQAMTHPQQCHPVSQGCC